MAFEYGINYKKCRWCGHRPTKEPSDHCMKCGKPYKEIYSTDEEKDVR